MWAVKFIKKLIWFEFNQIFELKTFKEFLDTHLRAWNQDFCDENFTATYLFSIPIFKLLSLKGKKCSFLVVGSTNLVAPPPPPRPWLPPPPRPAPLAPPVS